MSYYYTNILVLCCTVLMCCGTSYCGNVLAQNSLERQLYRLFEIWRSGHLEMLPFKLPALDKFVLPSIEGNYSGQGVKLSFSTSSMELTGIDGFSIESLQASEDTIDASIAVRIENATLFAEKYVLSGRAFYFYPLKGSGNMKVSFQEVNIFSYIQLETNGTSLWMKKFKFDFKVDKVQVIFKYGKKEYNENSRSYVQNRSHLEMLGELTNSSWPINKILKSDATDILKSYHEEIVQAVVSRAVPYANNFLVNFSIDELLNMFVL